MPNEPPHSTADQTAPHPGIKNGQKNIQQDQQDEQDPADLLDDRNSHSKRLEWASREAVKRGRSGSPALLS
jgi:hypothetical protein